MLFSFVFLVLLQVSFRDIPLHDYGAIVSEGGRCDAKIGFGFIIYGFSFSGIYLVC
jgi:hypothetical protein